MTLIRYRAVPVALFIELQELLDGVQREVQIATLGAGAPVADDVVEGIVVQREALRDVRVALLDQAEAARAAGRDVVDLEAEYPDDPAQVLGVLRAAEAAEAATDDGRLLTPPPTAELRRFRAWLFGELERQMAGAEAQPFPPS